MSKLAWIDEASVINGGSSLPASTSRQTDLKLRISGGEPFKLVRLDAHEGLSEPFMISLDVLAKEEIQLLPNLGKSASVDCSIDGELLRHFNGSIIDARFTEELENEGFFYRLTLAPSSFFHEQGSNYRIFQSRSVIDIVKAVLDECKIDYRVKARGGTRSLAYCVQYGESDVAFVNRLLEEEGLYYFYLHTRTAHTMVICDDPGQHEELPTGRLQFNPLSDSVKNVDSTQRSSSGAGRFVQSWRELASSGAEARVTLRDYDFKQPNSAREAIATESKAHDEDTIEVYRWPGRYYDDGIGKSLGTVLLESRRAQRLRYEASSQFVGIQVGFHMALGRHPNSRFNRKYLITSCRTQLATEQFRSGMGTSASLVEFSTIPDDVRFRAPIVTPRPTAKGPETAVVTGPQGEEIHVDEFGRIKVQFHWDRQGALDDKSSCWIRVSQTGGLGNIIIPRVGHEVLIDFINGNPDRPIVVGRVFNAGHMPVYSLPQHKTRASWRSKTYQRDTGDPLSEAETLDSKAPGANELRFEDATGAEEVFFHAERDMNTRVRNNETHKVGKDVEITVGKNRTETVGTNEKILIKADRTEDVKGKETVTVVGDRAVKILSNDKLDVTGKIVITSGKEIEITAEKKITLTVGNSSITIDETSITIATVVLEMKGSATAKLTSAVTNVEAQGILTAKGSIVMIN